MFHFWCSYDDFVIACFGDVQWKFAIFIRCHCKHLSTGISTTFDNNTTNRLSGACRQLSPFPIASCGVEILRGSFAIIQIKSISDLYKSIILSKKVFFSTNIIIKKSQIVAEWNREGNITTSQKRKIQDKTGEFTPPLLRPLSSGNFHCSLHRNRWWNKNTTLLSSLSCL